MEKKKEKIKEIINDLKQESKEHLGALKEQGVQKITELKEVLPMKVAELKEVLPGKVEELKAIGARKIQELPQKIQQLEYKIEEAKTALKVDLVVLKQFVAEKPPMVPIVKVQIKNPRPVILVHGYFSDVGCWKDFVPGFTSLGFQEGKTLRVIDLEPGRAPAKNDIRVYAQRLGDMIEQVTQQTHSPTVDVVGHSMGGLVTRYYCEVLGHADKVNKLIMLGTPNRGSEGLPKVTHVAHHIEQGVEKVVEEVAELFGKNIDKDYRAKTLGLAAEQMMPGSDFLTSMGTKAQPNYHFVAGTVGLPHLFGDTPNDGAVAVPSVELDAIPAGHSLRLPLNHFGLHQHPLALNATLRYLLAE